MARRRTTFALGKADVDDLLAALTDREATLEYLMGFDAEKYRGELLRLYRLRTRLRAAGGRLEGERSGRSGAAA